MKREKQKITVIGIGRLGLSFALLLDSKGYEVLGCDINENYIDKLNTKTFESSEPSINEMLHDSKMKFTSNTVDALNFSDIIFVYVQTPSNADGAYSHNQIEDVITKFIKSGIKNKTIGIACTVMPMYCESLQERVKHLNTNIIYCPSLIAQGSICMDIQHADMVLLGGKDIPQSIFQLYTDIMDVSPNFKRMSLTAAELTKISLNCFLTTKISFANRIGEIAINSGVEHDVDAILDAVGSDTRVGNKFLKYGFGFSGVCVLPTQDIITKRGLLQIKDVKIGDYVLSHDGKFNRVTKLFKRPYNGIMHKFKLEGFSSDTLTITPEHQIFACHKIGDRYYSPNGKKRLLTMPKKYFAEITPSFIEAKDLQHGDFFCIPKLALKEKSIAAIFYSSPKGIGKWMKKFSDKLEITQDMMRFFGYYLAEGCTWKSEITLTFNKNESEFHDDVIMLLKNIFGLKTRKIIRRGIGKENTMVIRANSYRLVAFLKKTFGDGVANKKIPYEWLHLSDEHIINIIRGLWYGDGSNSTGIFTYTSISKELFTFCKLALNKLEIPFIAKTGRARIGNDGVNHKKSYTIAVGKAIGMKAINKIIPLKAIDMDRSKRGDKQTTFWQNGVYYYHVRSREDVQYNGYVYNIEVANSNSYMLSSSVVHNCLPRDNRALGIAAKGVGISPDFQETIDDTNNEHLTYIYNYFIAKNPDKNTPFIIDRLSYKSGVDIITESQPLKLCQMLLENNYRVNIMEKEAVLSLVREDFKKYGDRVSYNANMGGYKIDLK